MRGNCGFGVVGLVIFCLLASMALPSAGAAGSNTWQLDQAIGPPSNVTMYRDAGGEDSTDGSVTIHALASATWVADEVATTTVNFGQGSPWVARIVTGNAGNADLRIGSVNETGVFTDQGGTTAVLVATVRAVINADVTVEAGHRLAFRITNTGDKALPPLQILTGQAEFSSELDSPTSDPGYPVFELASVLLLGAGLVSIVGFTKYRRRGIRGQ